MLRFQTNMNIIPLFSAEQIQREVHRTAAEITDFFGEEEPVVVFCLLNGAIWFAADLLRCLSPNFELQTLRLSSYEGTESSGTLTWHDSLPDCKGKRVLVVDDVLDTGRTMQEVCAALLANGAAVVASAVAVDKKGRRAVDCRPDFCALCCEDVFLVGYGLDFNGKYRNLPYIGYVEE